jgi:hypothetical protein
MNRAQSALPAITKQLPDIMTSHVYSQQTCNWYVQCKGSACSYSFIFRSEFVSLAIRYTIQLQASIVKSSIRLDRNLTESAIRGSFVNSYKNMFH